MDLDTFLTTLYVLVDDWYKTTIVPTQATRPGAKATMSESEVLTVALAGQWRVGVPWRSERGVVRYMHAHGRGWFPTMLQRSAFNARVRQLWGRFVQLQQWLADQLSDPEAVYSVVDCQPLPACTLGQASRVTPHWLWLSQFGHGGTRGRWFYGDKLLAVVTPRGVVTGWLVGSAAINDRWLLEAFLSARAGQPQVVGPPPNHHQPQRLRPTLPAGSVRGWAAVGPWSALPYLADRNFKSRRWQRHWHARYGGLVQTKPVHTDDWGWSRQAKCGFSRLRQIIETTFARLDGVFGLKQVGAHSYWGQLTRVALCCAAYNLGLYLNHLLGRPLGSLETLIC